MTMRLTIARGAFVAAVSAMTLAGAIAAPQAASAQPYDGQQGGYDNPCQQQQTNREVAGGVLGAIGGAVLGSNLAHGGGRTGGALIGGAVGAAGGAAIGGATTQCDANQGYDQTANGPPPPPPPGYYDNGAPPPPPQYDNGGPGYGDGGPAYDDNCTTVDSHIRFPDGTMERDPVRVCQDPSGHWHVAE